MAVGQTLFVHREITKQPSSNAPRVREAPSRFLRRAKQNLADEALRLLRQNGFDGVGHIFRLQHLLWILTDVG